MHRAASNVLRFPIERTSAVARIAAAPQRGPTLALFGLLLASAAFWCSAAAYLVA